MVRIASRGGRAMALALTAAVALLALGFMIGQKVGAQAVEPGSEADPLVSQSYVDQFVKLEVVTLPKGKTLIVDLPGGEIILRGGKVTAIGSPAGGLSDLTGGKDLTTGATVPPNHLLLVPRNDGRGVKAVTDAILLVRGTYLVKQEGQ